jgi:hypothetical protein
VNEGPATDPEVLKKREEQMQKEMEKKADELRQKMQQQGQPATR